MRHKTSQAGLIGVDRRCRGFAESCCWAKGNRIVVGSKRRVGAAVGSQTRGDALSPTQGRRGGAPRVCQSATARRTSLQGSRWGGWDWEGQGQGLFFFLFMYLGWLSGRLVLGFFSVNQVELTEEFQFLRNLYRGPNQNSFLFFQFWFSISVVFRF